MDSTVHNFVNYLLYFGLIHPNYISSFENQYNYIETRINNNNERNKIKSVNKLNKSKSFCSIQNQKNNNEEIILKTLINYITGLTNNQIKMISKNILGKFNQNIIHVKYKFLNKILLIYSKQTLNLYFQKWRKINKNMSFLLNKSIEKSKESKILKNYENNSVHLKRFYSNPKYKNILYYKEFNLDKNYRGNTTNNFIARQEEYFKKKELKKKMIQNKSEEEIDFICSFAPKLNTISHKIKSKYKTIEKSRIESQRRKSKNLSPKKKNNISVRVSERLYKDFNKLLEKRTELTKVIDSERGITFKPQSFTINSKYNKIESNFEDRNKKLLEDRQNFAFVYDYLRQKQYDENLVGGGKRIILLNNYINKNKNKKINYETLLKNSNDDNDNDNDNDENNENY